MNKTYLSLGSNRGDRMVNLERAIKLLGEWAGNIMLVSSLYETPPWRMADETNFLNQVLLMETKLDATELMDIIIQIELIMGRVRTTTGYEPRTIDIDILFYNEQIINNGRLTIPHPLIQLRRFILHPLNEIAPEFVHPVLKKSIGQLLLECEDKSAIRKPVSK
jgi:2-amino-4-hydroxy-6-hydroxymethyldihydropteridine diphosphokinase